MFDDKIIGYNHSGKPVYDNTPTVVAVIFPVNGYTMAIRRARNPGKGKLALPGGFQMRGETWQEAGAREALEETGYIINPDYLEIHDFATDEYGHNLLITTYVGAREPKQDPKFVLPSNEIAELVTDPAKLKLMGDWAFPRHFVAWAQTELLNMLK